MTKATQYLTKSLHTVTAVSRVAYHIAELSPLNLKPKDATKRALAVLGQAGPWPEGDPTVEAAVKATKKLMEHQG